MYEQFTVLKVERRESVLWVEMPDSYGIHAELNQIFRLISRDSETRAVVLTGQGDRAFCVGGGGASALESEMGTEAWWLAGMPGARELVLSMLECDKPVIARINGHAVGVGCSIALCCDITVMVESAKIGDTHVKIGLAAGDGGSLLWPALVGWMNAKRYLLTGDLMTGKQAAEIGLITQAVSRTELDSVVEHWADRLANGATMAIGLTKRAINMSIRQQAQIHMDASLGLETMSFLTKDYQEGLQAMLQKRAPVFKGR